MEYFLAIPIIVWGLVNFTTYRSVRLLAKTDELLEEAKAIDDEVFLREKEEFDRWCQNNDFAHEKNFLFYGIISGPPIKCSAWWSSADKTWALIYVTQMGKNIDFVTTYENGIGVTTASSKDSLTLPSAPNSYIQAFTKTPNDERYALHKHAVASIEKKRQIAKGFEKQELFKLIEESIFKQVAFIQKMPFWYLRGSYWYFISRSLKVNKKVRT